MSQIKSLRPKLRRIALMQLVATRRHSNRLSGRIRQALKSHMERNGLYPPLIVRVHSHQAGRYEILDGHQRAEILRELGKTHARCEVWPVDEAEAELCVATLNHLRGRPVATRRARQIRRLVRRLGEEKVRRLLGLTPAALRQQHALLDRAAKPVSVQGTLDLQPVTFHLPAAGVTRLRRTLAAFGNQGHSRGQKLLAALKAAQKSHATQRR